MPHSSRALALPSVLCLGLALLTACYDPVAYREKIEASVYLALESGNSELAIGLLEAALQRDPRDAASARQLAELYLSTQDVWRALSVLQSLPTSSPRNRAFLLTYAEALVRANRLERAAKTLLSIEAPGADLLDRFFVKIEQAPTLFQEDLPATWMLRLAELEIGADDLTSATFYLDRVDPLDAARAPLLDTLFQRLLAYGHLGKAAQLPGLALHQLADDDNAKRRLGVALAIDPQHRRARELLDRIDPSGNSKLTLEIAPRS